MKFTSLLPLSIVLGWLSLASTHASAQLAPSPPVGGGMSFSPNWLPTHLETKSKLLDGLEFYASRAAGKGKQTKENYHRPLVGGFTWRMTLEEAIKTLPAKCDRAPEEKIKWDCFPQDSLSVFGFHTNFFIDRGQEFDWLYLIVDRERRLVGVEFVATNPKKIMWNTKLKTERMEPYYDFIKMKNNASTTQHVDYQIIHPEKGAPLIHTALVKNAFPFKVLEDVHWYLAPPFARALLDVVEWQHKMALK